MKINKYELARSLGVSHQAVYKWFNGKSMPRADKLSKIAKILGISVEKTLELFIKS